jgi:hypothetical protein
MKYIRGTLGDETLQNRTRRKTRWCVIQERADGEVSSKRATRFVSEATPKRREPLGPHVSDRRPKRDGTRRVLVELEGIEPSSAKGLQPAIRPFPIHDLTAVVRSGPREWNKFHSGCRIFLRCQRSFTPSVVSPYCPSPLLLPGCGEPAPRDISARNDSLLSN